MGGRQPLLQQFRFKQLPQLLFIFCSPPPLPPPQFYNSGRGEEGKIDNNIVEEEKEKEVKKN